MERLQRLLVQTSLLTVKLTMMRTQAAKSDTPQEVAVEIDFDKSMDVFPCIEVKLVPVRKPRN